MKISFYYEYGEIIEIGTGHRYRSIEIGRALEKRNHTIEYMENNTILYNPDVLVVDHMNSCRDIIVEAKSKGIKVVLIDGHKDDVVLVDASISAVVNTEAQYYGIKYLVFPISKFWDKYRYKDNNTIFIGMGGFDANNIAELVLGILEDMGINSIVANSINHDNLSSKFSRTDVFSGKNYFDVMQKCTAAITNGGLTFFQSLCYGLPTLAIPQYEHQQINIDSVIQCCLSAKPNKDDVVEKIKFMISDSNYRKNLSLLSKQLVGDNGTGRICDIIEGLND